MIKTLLLSILTVVVPAKKSEPWLDISHKGAGYVLHNPKAVPVYVRFWCGMHNEEPLAKFSPGDTQVIFKDSNGEILACIVDDWSTKLLSP